MVVCEMFESFCFSLTLVLMFQVAGTAESNEQRSILEHPLHGNVSCSSVCPPEKSRDKDIVFCRDNCQDYWNWMISAIFADPPVRVNRTTDCTQHNFTHVPSNNVILCSNFRDFSNSTDNEKKFWSRNCISYFICIIGKSVDVSSSRNMSLSSSSTSSATPTSSPNPISFTDQPDQSSLSPWFLLPIVLGALCVALCVGLIALIIYLRRPRHRQEEAPQENELDVRLSLLIDPPAPSLGNPTDDNASERNAEPDAESMPTGLPIQEVGDPSHPTEASWTTPKEIDSTRFSFRSDPCTEGNAAAQQNPVEGNSSLGPRAGALDVSLES